MGEHLRINRIAAGAVAAVTLATGGTLAYSATAQASTTHQTSRGFMYALKTGASFAIDGVTYQARATSRDKWTAADQRLCAEFTFPHAHANVPTIRELAYDATYTNGWLQQDTEALVTFALAGRRYGKEWRQVQWDCN
jgi:hypothetical protein